MGEEKGGGEELGQVKKRGDFFSFCGGGKDGEGGGEEGKYYGVSREGGIEEEE